MQISAFGFHITSSGHVFNGSATHLKWGVGCRIYVGGFEAAYGRLGPRVGGACKNTQGSTCSGRAGIGTVKWCGRWTPRPPFKTSILLRRFFLASSFVTSVCIAIMDEVVLPPDDDVELPEDDEPPRARRRVLRRSSSTPMYPYTDKILRSKHVPKYSAEEIRIHRFVIDVIVSKSGMGQLSCLQCVGDALPGFVALHTPTMMGTNIPNINNRKRQKEK